MLCNKRLQKLNINQTKNQLLKIAGNSVAVCEKFTHEQRRLLPGGTVVKTQKYADTLFMPTLAMEGINTIFDEFTPCHGYGRVVDHNSAEVRTVTHSV